MALIWGFGVRYKKLKSIIFLICISTSVVSVAEEEKASIFTLTSQWQDQNGKNKHFKDYKGKIIVLSMIYTSCDYSCPLITRKLKQIYKKTSKKTLKNTQFLMVTFDPKTDTPKKLKEYSLAQKLDESRFALLTSNSENAHILGLTIGFQYKQMPDGNYSHSNLVTIFDKNGAMVHQQDIGKSTDAAVEIIENLNKNVD